MTEGNALVVQIYSPLKAYLSLLSVKKIFFELRITGFMRTRPNIVALKLEKLLFG